MENPNRSDFDTVEEYVLVLESYIGEQKAKLAKGADLRFKVSEKGGLSIYGLGRFPVTLYASQWVRLLSHAQAIVDFLKDNASALKSKDDKPVVKAAA